MAEINFCDRAICITDVSLVSWRRKLLIKFTHRGIPVAFSSRGESVRNFVARISRARSGLLIDRERGTCQWATIISIIWLSGENGAWTKKLSGREVVRPNDSSDRRHVVQKRLFVPRLSAMRNASRYRTPREDVKIEKKRLFRKPGSINLGRAYLRDSPWRTCSCRSSACWCPS